MTRTGLFPIHAGFLPLLDSAILVAAREKNFARDEGIDLTLARENSWANIRDRMAIGHFEAAHLLAPMPIAARLGLTPMPLDVIAPMALGLGGNAVTVSSALAEAMAQEGDLSSLAAGPAGRALAAVAARRRRSGQPTLVFAVVHPHSGHNYELRYWLAASGVDPDRDMDIVIVPPPLLPDALAAGRIDGYCVGEPWNSVAVARGSGVIVTTKSGIWRSSPEKVLGISGRFAQNHPEILKALLRALWRAAEWCGDPQNHEELAHILAADKYVSVAPDLLLPALSGVFKGADGAYRRIPDFFIPFERAATFPWISHALWFYSQMVRWGQAEWDPGRLEIVAQSYRPDLYRNALAALDIPLPAASAKVEGALTETVPVGASKGELLLGPDGFFDGKSFDPDAIESYIRSFESGSIRRSVP